MSSKKNTKETSAGKSTPLAASSAASSADLAVRSASDAAEAAPAPPAESTGSSPAVAVLEQFSEVVGWVAVRLPSRFPTYLAGAAATAVGLIDPPAAVGAAIGYEMLRRQTFPATRG